MKRNRLKRLLREAFRLSQHDWPGAYDVVISVKPHEPLTVPHFFAVAEALGESGVQLKIETNGQRLRAGLPADWRMGSKTGGGGHGSSNDVGIFWPPGRPPVVVAVYITGTEAPPVDRDAAIAAVARRVTAGPGRS